MKKILKSAFFCALALLSMSQSPAQEQKENKAIKFGLIADAQYGDCDSKETRFYRNSLSKLDDCIKKFNTARVDFTINLGDLVDRSPQDMKPALERLSKLKTPVYNTTGNHDYKGVTDNAELYTRLRMPAEYYSFTKNKWRFILLNTNEVASYSNCKGTWKAKELSAMKKRITADSRDNKKSWNGGISSKQMKWLTEELKAAQKNEEHVLIFSHHPLYPAKDFTALNDKEILETLSAFPCVKAVISGHHHPGAYGEYKGIPCITLEGMISTENANSYAIVEIKEKEIVLTGSGRAKNRSIPLEEAK